MSSITQISQSLCFGGTITKYRHTSISLLCDMLFNVFIPSSYNAASTTTTATTTTRIPGLLFLSGLTSNEDNFITKSGACQWANMYGIALICPDTSPRNVKCPLDDQNWDFGQGASYYVDATESDYKKHYQMYTYITDEFYNLIVTELPLDKSRLSIGGHSVGGHGAIMMGLRNPHKFHSISAFAPMSHPTQCAWGIKAFNYLLGSDTTTWNQYDSTYLVQHYTGPRDINILIDQGSNDQYLTEYLHIPTLITSMKQNPHIHVDYRLRPGYDHGYWYLQTFIREHIEWHCIQLGLLSS